MANLHNEQRIWFFNNMPLTETQLTVKWAKSSKTLKVIEVPLDLSFEAFYNRYAYKVGEKKKCIKLWNELNPEKRTKALIMIPKYFRWLEHTNTAKVYPERYLSKEYYENEYK